jgi:hypothetical protein
MLIFVLHCSLIIAACALTTLSTPDSSNDETYRHHHHYSARSSILGDHQSDLAATDQSNLCPYSCSIDYCLQYASISHNCTRFVRDHCQCCTVCLRNENEICGGHLNVYGLCRANLLCSATIEQTDSPGICVQGKCIGGDPCQSVTLLFSLREVSMFDPIESSMPMCLSPCTL